MKNREEAYRISAIIYIACTVMACFFMLVGGTVSIIWAINTKSTVKLYYVYLIGGLLFGSSSLISAITMSVLSKGKREGLQAFFCLVVGVCVFAASLFFVLLKIFWVGAAE